MAEDNIQLAEKQIAAINARDLDGYLQRIDDSYEGESETASGPIRGPEGVRQNFEMLFRAFPDLRLEVERILSSGNHVVTCVRVTGTHRGTFAGIAPTNKSVSWQGCTVTEIRNGKVIRSRVYADNASLFRQLGALSIPRATAAG